MKAEFGDKITLSLVIKSIDNAANRSYHENIQWLDDHIPERYSAEEILALIGEASTAEKTDV